MTKNYEHSRNSVFNLGYHLIWCTKYRRRLLVNEIEVRLIELLNIKSKELDVNIQAVEIMPDHVHIFVKTSPKHTPHLIVKGLKGYTSRLLRSEFSLLRTRVPTLWTNSYYCESIGHISEKTVQKYIEEQKLR